MNTVVSLVLTLSPDAVLAQSLRSGGGGGGGPVGEADALFLVSFWKPLLTLIPFLGWAWLVATVYDKDAARWYFKRKQWNIAHMLAGAAGLAAVLTLPSFWIGWPVMLAVLGADLGAYFVLRNRDDRVPERLRWRLDFSHLKERSEQRKAAKAARTVTLGLRGPRGVIAPPERGTPEYEVRAAAEGMIIDGVDNRASEFEMGPASDSTYRVVYVVDGAPHAPANVPAAQAVAIIDLLKTCAGLDVQDRRRKLQGNFEMEQAGAKRKLRVQASGAQGGMRLRLMYDPDSRVRFSLDEIGLLEAQRKELDEVIAEGKGAVLVASPPRQGRTSTLYAILRQHDAYTTNVQTVELEPQDTIEGVRHNRFDPATEAGEYSTTVRSILRRDPDVVMVAELPDVNTAKEVAKADHNRTRIYVGLNAQDSLVAVQTFLKAVDDAKLAGGAIHGVVAQKLVRKLCQNCRVEYQPTPDMVKKLGVPPERARSLFRKGGQVLIKNKPETCPVCGGTGYFGQEAVAEVFAIGAEERKLIAEKDLTGLRAAMRKRRLPFLQEAAVQKVLAGVTSVEEVVRVTTSARRPSTGGSSGGGSGGGGGGGAAAPKPSPKPAGQA